MVINAMEKKKSFQKEEYRGGATLNKVMKEGHIQEGIFEATT